MENGDVILNVNNRLVVTFKGWIAGDISTYEVNLEGKEEEFTGTVTELLKYCYELVEEYNKKCFKDGGVLI